MDERDGQLQITLQPEVVVVVVVVVFLFLFFLRYELRKPER